MIFAFALNAALAADPAAVEFLTVDDAAPQRYEFSLRASDLDPAAKAHPELGFYIERDGKPRYGAFVPRVRRLLGEDLARAPLAPVRAWAEEFLPEIAGD